MPQVVWPDIPPLTLTSVIDILAVTVLIYNFVQVLRGRRAIHVLSGAAALVVLYLIAVWLQFDVLRTVLAAIGPYAPFALIVMFQAELRGWLTRLSRIRWLNGGWLTLSGRLERREVVDEILSAVEQMMETKTGALIVLERDIGLRTFIESGVRLDAVVSRDLLCAIFYAGAQLHDGAVIVQGDRIAAAACFLPLHVHPAGPQGLALKKLGTRHRAAIGVTEDTDALAVVVSEETSHVSIAWKGDLEPDISLDRLRELLTHHATGTKGSDGRAAEAQFGSVPQ
ncbi:MAG: diadenylate cyclase CdaA [Acidobacteriota bacterium]